MLRITSNNGSDEYLLKLEGCLVGAWVPELAACWREVSGRVPPRRVRVDLTDVSRVDAAGLELMTVMYRAGVHFVAKGFVIPELLREISETVDNRRKESCLP
jgi:ABC-type transporter Mla MlaB component